MASEHSAAAGAGQPSALVRFVQFVPPGAVAVVLLDSATWEAALRLAVDNPLGVGLGRSGAAISAAAPGGRTFVHAHNLWLNWLVEAGPLGLLAIAAVAVIAVSCAARAARAKSVIGTVGLAALTGFFLMSMTDHPADLDRIDALLWCALAVIMAETPATWRNRPGTTPALVPARPKRPRHGPRRVGAAG
ncbi:O-antigen ligase family protein [Streptomyces sp. Lzd4kr]|nr:O-antigen ligase family protein [Streptomyces sp. Lzd4kr]